MTNSKQTKISIIIRTKNEEKWITHCLDAVFNQKIDAKIISIDLTNRKFALSIRQLEIDEEQSLLEKYGSKSSGSVLGDILGKALDEDKGTKEE